MPARNIYHDAGVKALQADGWTITDDPLWLGYGTRSLYIDLGAERALLAAERGTERIAVEVQSFVGISPVHNMANAMGQYGLYRGVLEEAGSDRTLYMAVTQAVYETLFAEKFGQLAVRMFNVKLLVVDEDRARIVKWTS
jgi:hypothetical protein